MMDRITKSNLKYFDREGRKAREGKFKLHSSSFAYFATFAICIFAFAIRSTMAEEITITVKPGTRQVFEGFGISLANWNNAYGRITQAQRDELSSAIFKELKFNSLRLWFMTFEFAPTRGAKDLSAFKKQYIDPGIIADAKKLGVRYFLLAPDHLPEYMKEKLPGDKRRIKESEVENYAILLADAIVELHKAGVPINVTGIQNEASDEDHFSPKAMADAVKFLRRELEKRQLREVTIIASENASCNEIFAAEVNAMRADKESWDALGGIASHSYNMAANDEIAEKIENKENGRNLMEYWMTEASENGIENANDARRATSISARFLNDLNHRVTHWIHFLGYEIENNRDDATAIIKYTPEPFKVTKLLKFFTYKQLSHTFEVGAEVRRCESSLEKDMLWTYGLKPRLVVAAARNRDGTWGIGLANYTADSFLGVQGWGDDQWNREQGGHTPKQKFEVTIDVKELAGQSGMKFDVIRTNEKAAYQSENAVVLKDGKLKVAIDSMEVVTLRSVK